MRNIFRLLVFILLLALACIQFIQPEKNLEKAGNSHLFSQEKVPQHIKKILVKACLDCHSDYTHYRWYNKVAPISWMTDKHIVEGKKELNVSVWSQMDIFQKITILEEICQETERKTMPLKSYRFIHSDARLTKEQINDLCKWATALAEELLANAAKK